MSPIMNLDGGTLVRGVVLAPLSFAKYFTLDPACTALRDPAVLATIAEIYTHACRSPLDLLVRASVRASASTRCSARSDGTHAGGA